MIKSKLSIFILSLFVFLLVGINDVSLSQVLKFPTDRSVFQNSRGVYLRWKKDHQFTDVHLSKDSLSFTTVALNTNDSVYNTGNLDTSATYYWRIIGIDSIGNRDTSAIRRFTTGDPFLKTKKFFPAEDSIKYDTEMDSQYEDVFRFLDLKKTVIIIIDFWDPFVDNSMLNTAALVRLAHRHNLPILYSLYGGTLNRLVERYPEELDQDAAYDAYLKQMGFENIIYAGFDSGICVSITRANSINRLTLRNPEDFNIFFVKDCTSAGSSWVHYWNVQSIETRWQTTMLNDLATALGDTVNVLPTMWWTSVFDLPMTDTAGSYADSSKTGLFLINTWLTHENDGWEDRFQNIYTIKTQRLLRFARAKKYKIIHVPNGREIDSTLKPLPGELVFNPTIDRSIAKIKDSLWTMIDSIGIRKLVITGNFVNDLYSLFPIFDAWGLTFHAGVNEVNPNNSGRRTIFIKDAMTAFENPATLSNERMRDLYIFRSIYGPNSESPGTIHYANTLLNFFSTSHTNQAPVFISQPDTIAKEDTLFYYHASAVDPDSLLIDELLRFELINSPEWLTIDSLSGIITGLPLGQDVGYTVVSIVVRDEFGARTTQQFDLHVLHTNHAPVIHTLNLSPAVEDVLYSQNVYASDKDSSLFGDLIRYQIIEGPGWLTIDSITGLLEGKPPNNSEGDTVLSIIADDRLGGVTNKTWILKILPTNFAPVFIDTVDPLLDDTLTLFKIPVNRVFSWIPAVDPDLKDTLFYSFVIRSNDFDTVITGIRDTLIFVDERILTEETQYEWQVLVSDGEFVVSSPDTFRFQTTKRFSNATYTETPTTFFMYQNYPNPFNPQTTLRFQVPEESKVRIEIYNILGQLVQVVFKGDLSPKYYEIEWKPQAIASGIYFIKLNAEGIVSRKKYQSVKKMNFVK